MAKDGKRRREGGWKKGGMMKGRRQSDSLVDIPNGTRLHNSGVLMGNTVVLRRWCECDANVKL